jgi:hypothetical protein
LIGGRLEYDRGPDRSNVGAGGYSGFFDNGHRGATGLDQWLKSKQLPQFTPRV